MKDWWLSLEPSERRTLVLGGAALIAIIWFASYLSVSDESTELRLDLAEQREEIAWMRQAAQEVIQLRATSGPRAVTDDRSLFAVIDSSAKQAGVAGAITRIQPSGNNEAKVWMDKADFNQLLPWLGRLNREYGIRVSDATLTRGDNAGIVEARLTLERPAP